MASQVPASQGVLSARVYLQTAIANRIPNHLIVRLITRAMSKTALCLASLPLHKLIRDG